MLNLIQHPGRFRVEHGMTDDAGLRVKPAKT